MSEFTSFFNNSKSFGLNIKLPEKTVAQAGKTAEELATGVFEPLFTYLEENENVFSGDIVHELNKTRAANFNTTLILQEADIAVNGPRPTLDITW